MPVKAKVKGRSAESSPVTFRDVIGEDVDTAQDATLSLSLLTHKHICPDAEGPANKFVHTKVNTVAADIGLSSLKMMEELSKLLMTFETPGLKLHFEVDVLATKFDVKTMNKLSPTI